MGQVHLTLSKEAMDELSRLKKDLKAASISEVIRSSIALKKFITMEQANGNEIIVRDKKTEKEKVIATLH